MLQIESDAASKPASCKGGVPQPQRFCSRLEAVPLEALRLHGQQVLDVRAAREDALQVDPAPLHVDPHVEEGHDAVQLVFPAQRVLLEHLAGRRRAEVSG